MWCASPGRSRQMVLIVFKHRQEHMFRVLGPLQRLLPTLVITYQWRVRVRKRLRLPANM
jgi:hypothetical protein